MKYSLRHRLVAQGETWEFWQGFREIAMVRMKTDSAQCDVYGEWLGWGRVRKLYCQVELPAEVNLGSRTLDANEVNKLAARMHLALCAMKERNVVVQKRPWPALTEVDRETSLRDFTLWMEQRGWRVSADRAGGRISIKSKRHRIFRRRIEDVETLEQGAWVARAYHALLFKEVDRTVLCVSEGAGETSSWLAELSWR